MTVVRGAALEFELLEGRRSANPLAGEATRSSVRVVELDSPTRRQAHFHPLTEELIYVVTGSGSMWIAGRWHTVTAGDIAIIPAGEPHATVPDEGSVMRLVCFFPHDELSKNTVETDTIVEPSERVRTRREK